MIENYKQLGYAVLGQAIKDFFNGSVPQQQKIIKDLKSPWMDWLTNGLSIVAAKQLKENPGKIRRKLKKGEKNYEN